jgi:Flp pilus assembly protein TadD
MALKKYVEAVAAYTKSRDLYRSQAGRQFSNQQEAQRYRRDRITEIDEQIRMAQTGPQTMQSQDQLRQLQNTRRDMMNSIERGTNMTLETSVPAFVSLALGSAYFRTEKLADAEREYKAAIAADPKSGEAHNNLAVVCMLTGRVDEAERSLAQAKKVGFKVNPQLEQDIKNKKRGS